MIDFREKIRRDHPKWIESGNYGWKHLDYTIGLYYLDGCSLFQIRYKSEAEPLKTCNDFDECVDVARKHYAEEHARGKK